MSDWDLKWAEEKVISNPNYYHPTNLTQGIPELNKPWRDIDWEKAFIQTHAEVQSSIRGNCLSIITEFKNKTR